MAQTVPQDSGCTVEIEFLDNNGVAVAPVTATYRITDINSGVRLQADTEISPLSSIVNIEIAPSVNALRNNRLELEPKALTVTYTFDDGRLRTRTAEYQYNVERLYGRV